MIQNLQQLSVYSVHEKLNPAYVQQEPKFTRIKKFKNTPNSIQTSKTQISSFFIIYLLQKQSDKNLVLNRLSILMMCCVMYEYFITINCIERKAFKRMISFTEILACNGTALYEAIPKQSIMSFVTSGKLSILLAYDGMIMIQLNQFSYGINSELQIIYDDQDPQFVYVFYLKRYPEGQWVLKINQNGDEVFSCFNQKCFMKPKREKTNICEKQVFVSTEKVVKKAKVKLDQPKVQKANNHYEQEVKEKSLLVGASKQIGKGLVFTGKVLSMGFQKLGGFLSKTVKPSQKTVTISQSNKNRIDLTKKTTKNILTFTSTQVAALFNFGKSVAKDAGQTFQKSQKGQELQKNQYYGTVKQGLKTGGAVLANLYDGVVNAVYEIGSGASKGTAQVIGAKYGSQAGQAADGILEGVGNVAKMARVPKDQLSKALKQ